MGLVLRARLNLRHPDFRVCLVMIATSLWDVRKPTGQNRVYSHILSNVSGLDRFWHTQPSGVPWAAAVVARRTEGGQIGGAFGRRSPISDKHIGF